MTMDEVMKIVEREVELAKQRVLSRFKSLIEDANQTSLSIIQSLIEDDNQTSSRATNLKLKFSNKISPEILMGEEIKGEGNTPLEVALVDDHTGNIVDVGPEASASVEIVLLKGETVDSEGCDDWTTEEFNNNIVPEPKDKKPFLDGNVLLKLQSGIGVVENVKFRHHAIKIRPSVFKLGAKVIGASGAPHRIKEAKTESFTLKDFRNRYCKKHETPSLSDEVSRLVDIREGGRINKCLEFNQINTVDDIVIRLQINPGRLKNIVNLGTNKRKATFNDARACPSESRMYCYNTLQQKGAVFSVLREVLTLYFKFHRVNSTMNSIRETGRDESGKFSTTDSSPVRFSPRWPFSMMRNVYESTKQNYGFKMPLDGHRNESNADGKGAAAALTIDESEVVHTKNRWRKLFCVSVWLSVRKVVSLDVTHRRKKPKIG